MKIKEQSIQGLKDSLAIEEIVGKYVNLDKKGTAPCPFHNEKTASFHVNMKENFFKCFGCGKGGDAIAFVMEHERLDYPEAIKHLAEMTGYTLEFENQTPEQMEADKKAKDEITQMYEANEWALARFREALLQSKEAQQYLKEVRKYTLEQAIEMEMGFAPDSWDWLKNQCIEKGNLPIALKLGFVVEKNEKVFDFFRNRIVFPVRDYKKRVCGFTCRDLGNDPKSPKYLNSHESAIYNKEAMLFGIDRAMDEMKKTGDVFIVEGSFDVTTSHLKAYRNVVATCGTALTKTHLHFLKRFCKNIYLLRDKDDAGVKACLKEVDMIMEAGMTCYVTEIKGKHKDIDEVLRGEEL